MGITLIFDRNCDKMEGSLFDISALQKIHREGRRCLPGAIPYRERRVRERKTAGLPLTHRQVGARDDGRYSIFGSFHSAISHPSPLPASAVNRPSPATIQVPEMCPHPTEVPSSRGKLDYTNTKPFFRLEHKHTRAGNTLLLPRRVGSMQ